MKKFNTICISLLILGFWGQQAFAGWPIGKYRNVVVPSFNYYRSSDFYNQNGHIVKSVKGSGFTSYTYGLYVGYGLTRRLDLIVNILAPYQISTYPGTLNQEAFGLGDAQAGLSYNLVNFGYKSFLSVQVSGIAPLYKNDNKYLSLGYGAFGTEVKLMYSGALTNNFLHGCYYNLETGYRRYFDPDGPNILIYTASLGYPLDNRNQLNAEISGQDASSKNKSFNQNLSINKDFAFTKGALNYGHTFSRRFSVFAGGFYTFIGRNAGVGYGGSIQTIIKL